MQFLICDFSDSGSLLFLTQDFSFSCSPFDAIIFDSLPAANLMLLIVYNRLFNEIYSPFIKVLPPCPDDLFYDRSDPISCQEWI